jgi:putative ABC transport system substrate-binding protein
MRRREFVALLGVAASLPFVARAQQAERVRRIGVLMAYAESDHEAQVRLATLREELQKLGWIEGRNIQIDVVWSTAAAEKIQRSAQQFVFSQPDLIVSSSTPTTEALLKQTGSIPIIFATVGDPVGSGFVASLPRPGGNATGFTNLEGSIAGKWLELLKEVAPDVKRVAFVFNAASSPFFETYLKPFRTAAAALAIEGIATQVDGTAELEATIGTFAKAPNGGLVVMPGPFMANRSEQVTSLASRYSLPAVYPFRYYAERGGLLSYGNDQADNYRRVAGYVDRILKGAKPGDLPVQAPVKFELTVNLKTARALGLDVPQRLVQQADLVIE